MSVTLRPLQPSDKPGLSQLLTDPAVRRYLGGPVDRIDERLQTLMERPDGVTRLAIGWRHQFCGLITLAEHCEEPETELSYLLLPEYHGRNIAFTGVSMALNQRCGPFIAETQVANDASRRLLKRLGFNEIRTIKRFGQWQVIAKR